MLATIPVLFSDAKISWSQGSVTSVYSRPEFDLGRAFMKENDSASFRYFTMARWALIPICSAGGWVAYLWARELYGTASGLIAVILYSFCPNLVAWGASITPDAVCASAGLLAGYAFWRWLRRPTWESAAIAGITLGFAELTKTTWIVLLVLWPVLWALSRLRDRREAKSTIAECAPVPGTAQIIAILVIGVYILNLGYAFSGTLKPLGQYRFVSIMFSGQVRPPEGGNRFESSCLALFRVPFPEDYVLGIDLQRYEFEQKKWSYLRGEQKKGGWWYYYLYASAVKMPLGSLALFGVALVYAVLWKRRPTRWLDELVLLSPAIAVFVLVSSQTGINRYYRYVVPALPFLYVAASHVGFAFRRRLKFLPLVISLILTATIVESIAVVPHSMSFFNLLAGGPLRGNAHLVDANLDWGQDLLFLKKWRDARPEAYPLHLAYFSHWNFDPRSAGIDWSPFPKFHSTVHSGRRLHDERLYFEPGWYAISANYLKGYRYFGNDDESEIYACFQNLHAIGMAGYSIYIFHVTADQASQIEIRLRSLVPIAIQ